MPLLNYNNSFKPSYSNSFMANEKKRLKMAVIAGASHAIKYKERHPGAQADEVINFVSKEVDLILEKVDKDMN